jgi:hypothetical protein
MAQVKKRLEKKLKIFILFGKRDFPLQILLLQRIPGEVYLGLFIGLEIGNLPAWIISIHP